VSGKRPLVHFDRAAERRLLAFAAAAKVVPMHKTAA